MFNLLKIKDGKLCGGLFSSNVFNEPYKFLALYYTD